MRYLVLFLLPLFATRLFAAECTPEVKENTVCCSMFSRELYPNYLYVGVNCFGLEMNSQFKNHFNLSESGVVGGFNLGYEYLKPSFLYAGIDIASSVGSSSSQFNYYEKKIGSTDGDTGVVFGEFRLGYTALRDKLLITPCAGAGLYALISDRDDASGLGIYYALLELRLLYQKSALFDFGLTLTGYGEFSKRPLHKHNADFIDLSVGSDWGGRIAIPLIWHIDQTRRWELRLEPFVTALSFSQTELFYGANFFAGYHF